MPASTGSGSGVGVGVGMGVKVGEGIAVGDGVKVGSGVWVGAVAVGEAGISGALVLHPAASKATVSNTLTSHP
ncbi:hypothetical protein [Bellilinea sp.]